MKLNQFSEAEKCLKEAIGLTSDEKPYLTLAKIYIEEDRVVEATKVYESALRSVKSIKLVHLLQQLKV